MEVIVMKNKWRIIFDYDDTLIRHDTEKELIYMAEYLNLKYDNEFKRQITAFYHDMTSWLPKGKINKVEYESYLFNKVPLFYQNGLGIKELFEAESYKDRKMNLKTNGVQELLEYLASRNYYMCILTNGFFYEQCESLKSQGLYQYFEKVYAWDDFYAKPDERAFLRALEQTDPVENIMVGNNLLHDIIPAKKLGIYTFGVHLMKNAQGADTPDIELNELIDIKKYL